MKDSNEIIEKQRMFFKEFMLEHGLNANAWAKKAGIAEATIRHYLSGRNKSITSVNLERLAQVVGCRPDDIIGERGMCQDQINQGFEAQYFKPTEVMEVQRDLFVQAFIDFENFKIAEGSLSSKDRANALFSWCQIAQMLYKQSKTKMSSKEFKEIFDKVASGS